MPELTNKDLIRMHLEEFVRKFPDQSWASLLAYCVGYYGNIDTDIIWVVWEMQQEGIVK